MGRETNLDKIKLLGPLKDEAEYEERLEDAQKEMRKIQQWAFRERKRIVIAIEGWDAAGKGGFIQRLVALLDPRHVNVWSIGAPLPEEQGRHYLWRFWQKLPAPGHIAIFDRTWYGRVLVERVEKFCDEEAWRRTYDEINQFEAMLTSDGVRMVKLLLHVSEEEQKKRIIERMESAAKRFKVTMDDFRNIARRKDYLQAFADMLKRTDTKAAPWDIVATDYKWRARVEASEIVVDRLEKGADLSIPPLDPAIAEAAFKLWGWRAGETAKQKKPGKNGLD